MQGKIEQVRDSQSGKTLSVLVAGTWYSTKNWEFRTMVGHDIVFEPSTSEFNGKVMHWLNDYTPASGTTPADAAMQHAMAQQPQVPPTPPVEAYSAPQTASKDRDASIVAQALTKACTAPGDPVQTVWSRYTEFYNKYSDWNPGDFDDSVPY